ncbi:MAG: nitrous oxide reductase family maturation protein NosD [Bacteroidetes bacterium]|nr:nitrous oxide reductase family maturation protein NosD [Bacteroidota bacterium]
MRVFTFLFLIFLLAFAERNPAYAATIVVEPNSSQHPIQLAINQANAGDTILIKKGTYFVANILVHKRVTIRGINNPVIDGNGETEIFTVSSDGVIIEGLHIQNTGISYLEDRAGIRLKQNSHCIIRNNKLVNTFFGIYLEKSTDATIENNLITGNAIEENASGNAIHCWYSKRLSIRHNQTIKHRDGIYFEFVDNSNIAENESKDNLRYGLHFMFSNDNNYFQNSFSNNGAGVAVMFSKCINMWENRFYSNWGRASYGLLLKEITDTDISNNLFRENTIGIYVEGSSRIDYHHNEFVRNGWAIKMSGGCLDNHVLLNNFSGNSFSLSALASSTNSNTFSHNFWSDYNGYDLDKDNIGDIPHRPMKLFDQVVQKTPEALVLLRSLFIDLLNFSERVSPIFTPENICDFHPWITPVQNAVEL